MISIIISHSIGNVGCSASSSGGFAGISAVVIGQLGAGGNATGPHLHFEFHAGPVGKGNELNPYQIAHRHCTNRIPMEMPLNHGQEEDRETFLFPYGNFEWD